MNTFSIDENFITKKKKKKGGFLVTNLRKLKKIQITIHGNYDKDWRLEIKICHFWEFHKSRRINKRHKSRVTRIKKIRLQRKLGLLQSQIMKKKMVKERKKMHAWQWKGELGSDEIAMFLTLSWKMC